MPQGSKWKMGHLNMHKAPRRSQLSKADTGALERNNMTRPECAWSGVLTRRNTTRPNERFHKGENGKWAARTCTRHPDGHNLAKLIWAPSNETTRPERARSGNLTRHDTTHLTERICHKGENIKWAT